MSEISIIIPVYNAELYLHRCLESIVSQTISDFDVILIDDGSTDMSLRICEDYSLRDSRIHVLHQRNSGPSMARNIGIEWTLSYSNSSYITFVDSDDCLHPQFLEYMISSLKDTTIKVAMCHHKYIGLYDTFESIPNYSSKLLDIMDAESLMVSQSSSFNYIWGKVYLKECFNDVRYPENVSFGEDNLIIFKVMFEAGQIAYLQNDLYYYFYTPTGITKSPWSPRSLDVFEGIRVQLNYYQENGFEKAYQKELELLFQQYAYQIHRIREDQINISKNKFYLNQLVNEMKQLSKKNPSISLRSNFYWYEALYPFNAFLLRGLSKIKRIIFR